MAENEDSIKFSTLKSKFSQCYDSQSNYKWLRFCLFDYLPIGDLTSKSVSQLLHCLDNKGVIEPDDVHILSEIAELTCLRKAKVIVNEYMKGSGQKKSERKLSEYRKQLFEASRNVDEKDELNGIISHYGLSDEDFSTIWDFVFYLEKQKLLQDRPDEILRFSDCLNQTAKNYLLGISTGVQFSLRKRKTEDSDNQPSPKRHEMGHKLVLSTCNDKGEIIANYLYYRGCINEVTITEGCIVFHVTLVDPSALEKLWKLHQSGQLLKDIAEILFTEKRQKEFEQTWETQFDHQIYKDALNKLLNGKETKPSLHLNYPK